MKKRVHFVLMLLGSFSGLILDANCEVSFPLWLLLTPVFSPREGIPFFLCPPSPPLLTTPGCQNRTSAEKQWSRASYSPVWSWLRTILLDILALCSVAFLRAKVLSWGLPWCWGACSLGSKRSVDSIVSEALTWEGRFPPAFRGVWARRTGARGFVDDRREAQKMRKG